MTPVDLDSELVYEMEGPIKPDCCVFLSLHNLQTLVHSFPFTVIKTVEKVGRKCHQNKIQVEGVSTL